MASYSGDANDNVQNGTDHSDDFDFSQGGEDTLNGFGSGDIFTMNSAFDAGDQIDGGASVDLLALYGNYTRRFVAGHLVDSTVNFTATTLVNVENIVLEGGFGNGYHLILNATTAPVGFNLSLDGSTLTSGNTMAIDASRVAGNVSFSAGQSVYTLIGGSGNNTFNLDGGTTAGDSVVGGAGHNEIKSISPDFYTLSLPDPRFANISAFTLTGNGAYTITAGDAQTPAGRNLTLSTLNGSSLNFDGSAETNGSFTVSGTDGSDTLKGGAGDDFFDAGTGDATVTGGAGNDTFTFHLSTVSSVHINGGTGYNAAMFYMAGDVPISLAAGSLLNLQSLILFSGQWMSGQKMSLTLGGGDLAAGQTLSVIWNDISGLPIDVNASAETVGQIHFVMPGPNGSMAGGDHWTGGTGNDVFVAQDPSATSGQANIWDGGGGANILDYSFSAAPLTIDAVAQTAAGSGSVVDHFARFSTFKYGVDAGTFLGSSAAEIVSMDRGGNGTIFGQGGNDVFNFGGALTAADAIDGGANNDTLILDGNYSAGVSFNTSTVQGVEILRLQHLAGESNYSYKIATADGTVGAGQTLTVIAEQLTAAATVNFDGHAETNGHLYVIGGAGDDTLTGGRVGDTLNGGGGVDSLTGGLGNDAYVVDSAADHVVEATGGGTDTVFASVSYTLAAGVSVDVLATSSQGGTDAINLAGNALNQTLRGNSGDNGLNGGGGSDSLYGFGGNDRYFVDNSSERVFEVAGQGNDTVFASATYALQNGQSVEVLATSLQAGTTQLSLSGNNLAQQIRGNEGINGLYGGDGSDTLYGFGGNDRLVGGSGHDLMDGGAGNDVFAFSAVSDSTGVDRDLIQNMNLTAADKFQFTVKPTGGVATEVMHGGLNTVHFDMNLATAIGMTQLGAHQAVLFDPDAGDLAHHLFLIVDANGTAGYQAGADYVVELQGVTGTLTPDDFM